MCFIFLSHPIYALGLLMVTSPLDIDKLEVGTLLHFYFFLRYIYVGTNQKVTSGKTLNSGRKRYPVQETQKNPAEAGL